MNCAGLEGQIKGGGEFATRVMEDAINNESREKKLEIGRRSAAASRRPSTDHHRRGRPRLRKYSMNADCQVVQQYEDTSRRREEVVPRDGIHNGGGRAAACLSSYRSMVIHEVTDGRTADGRTDGGRTDVGGRDRPSIGTIRASSSPLCIPPPERTV